MLRSRRATPIQDIVDGATTEDRADRRQDHRLRIGATEHLNGKSRTRGERDRELGAVVGRGASVEQKPCVGGLTSLDALDDLGPFALELAGVLPQDDAVYEADCDGKPSSKIPDASPVKRALHGIMQDLSL